MRKVYFDDTPTSEPRLVYVDDQAPPSKSATTTASPARRQRRGLRNWLLCMTVIMAGGVLILYGWEGSVYLNPATAAVGLAIWLTTMLVMLTLRVIGRL